MPQCSYRRSRFALAMALLATVTLQAGCMSTRWTELRRRPLNPLEQSLAIDTRGGARPTDRTLQTLRRKNLASVAEESPEIALASLQEIATGEPTAENVYAIAEVAYVQAQRTMEKSPKRALDLYGTAVANAYFYLFDMSLRRGRNPYDPRFRRACDLYNNSLERALRHIQAEGTLQPGVVQSFETEGQVFDVEIAARGTWHERNFKQLKFVSDFKVKELTNLNRSYGLGVPMIAVYESRDGLSSADRFYPPGMSFPVTAFLRVANTTVDPANPSRVRHHCVLELHDPTEVSEIIVGSERVPLETDLTTPLAYSLENPAFKRANVPSRGLRDFEDANAVSGLYMLEPYNANKIPVVMVHGFWSSLVTWMEMFNDLRASSEIRDRYQFWFYLYPTGPPFWYSAAQLREQLAEARMTLDPHRAMPALDQMVLVGHSMGGLISLMQTVEGDDELWKLVSNKGADQIVTDEQVLARLQSAFQFQPNPSVRRVVTIATPHQGSNLSNGTVQWLGRKLIQLPDEILLGRQNLFKQNPDAFSEGSLLSMTTSVEALAESNPIWGFLRQARRAPWTRYHNIIGTTKDNRVIGAAEGGGDGIVTVESAKIPYAESQVLVPSEHTQVHRQPASILEVRRILLQHLGEVRGNEPVMTPYDLASHAK